MAQEQIAEKVAKLQPEKKGTEEEWLDMTLSGMRIAHQQFMGHAGEMTAPQSAVTFGIFADKRIAATVKQPGVQVAVPLQIVVQGHDNI